MPAVNTKIVLKCFQSDVKIQTMKDELESRRRRMAEKFKKEEVDDDVDKRLKKKKRSFLESGHKIKRYQDSYRRPKSAQDDELGGFIVDSDEEIETGSKSDLSTSSEAADPKREFGQNERSNEKKEKKEEKRKRMEQRKKVYESERGSRSSSRDEEEEEVVRVWAKRGAKPSARPTSRPKLKVYVPVKYVFTLRTQNNKQ